MRIVPFGPDHLRGLDPPLSEEAILLTAEAVAAGPAWTGVDDGRVVGCGGLMPIGDETHAWLLLSRGSRRPLAGATFFIRRQLRQEKPPVVAHVQADLAGFDRMDRWLRLLGFQTDAEGQLGPGGGPTVVRYRIDGSNHPCHYRHDA